MLKIAGNLSQPEAVERQRLALIPERFRADLASLDRSVSRTTDRISQGIGSAKTELGALTQAFEAAQNRVSASLEEMALERALLVTNGESLRHALSSVQANLSKDIAKVTDTLHALYDEKTNSLINVIDARNKHFVKNYLEAEEKSLARMKKEFEQALVRMMERHDFSFNRFFSSLERHQNESEDKLNGLLQVSLAKTDRQIEGFRSQTNNFASSASKEVEELLRRAEDATQRRSESLRTTLASNIIDLSKTFRTSADELGQSVGNVTAAAELIEVKTSAFKEEIGARLQDLEATVIRPLDHLTTAFGDKSRLVATEVFQQIASLNHAMEDVSAKVEAEFRRGYELFDSVSQSRSAELKAEIEKAYSGRAGSKRPFQDGAMLKTALDKAGQDTTTKPVRTAFEADASKGPSAALPPMVGPTTAPLQKLDKRSWITDLLERADAAGENQAVALTNPRSIEIMSYLTERIDNLLVTSALIAAWDRFRDDGSEEFVDIFTLDGLAFLADMIERLSSDAVLKDFVESYLSRFESLLKTAFTVGDDGALLSYMSSTGGKIYTFLAKSVGRI